MSTREKSVILIYNYDGVDGTKEIELFGILVPVVCMEGSGKQDPQEAELVVRVLTPDFLSSIPVRRQNLGLTCPHSRTRPAPFTDFNWPRPLSQAADHPRQEDHVMSARATRIRTVRAGRPVLTN